MTRDVYQIIVDPTRRQTLEILCGETLSVNEICEHFAMSQSAISQHLGVLREGGLVNVSRAGRKRMYTADPRPLLEVFEWIQHFQGFWPKHLDALGRYLESNHGEDS